MHKIIRSTLLPEDKNNTFDLLKNPKVMTFLGPRRALSECEANDWFNNELQNTHRFAFRLASNNELIGFCGISDINESNEDLDFGYFIREKFWGCGFAAIMCQQSIDHLKNEIDFNNIKVFIADENIASLRLAKKLNWTLIKKDSNEYETGLLFQIRSRP